MTSEVVECVPPQKGKKKKKKKEVRVSQKK